MSSDDKKGPKHPRKAPLKKTVSSENEKTSDSAADIITLEDFQRRRMHNESLRLLGYANQIDEIITGGIVNRHDLLDIAGVLAHRLGTLIGQLPHSDRDILHGVCVKVLTEQAQLK